MDATALLAAGITGANSLSVQIGSGTAKVVNLNGLDLGGDDAADKANLVTALVNGLGTTDGVVASAGSGSDAGKVLLTGAAGVAFSPTVTASVTSGGSAVNIASAVTASAVSSKAAGAVAVTTHASDSGVSLVATALSDATSITLSSSGSASATAANLATILGNSTTVDLNGGSLSVSGYEAVSYTHLTLPTILLV